MRCPNDMSIIKTDHAVQAWDQLSSRTLLDLPPWFKVYEDSIRLPSGRVIDDYYRIEAPDYVIMAVCDACGRFMLERQYKHGVGSIILTSPSGAIDEGELPLNAAQRELIEETGYTADHWVSVGSFLVDGTRGICRGHFFLARELSYASIPFHSDIETCEIVFLTGDEIRAAIADGQICLLSDIALYALASGHLFLEACKAP